MRRVLALVAVSVLAVACGGNGAGDAGPAPAPDPTAAARQAGFVPESDVTPHAAIGQDVAAVKAAMAPAAEGQAVDWAAVGEIFENGTGASKRGDGSTRSLASLMPEEESQALGFIRDAIAAGGASAGAADAVRRQHVEHGISVLLAEKVVEELGRARAKIEEDNLDRETGAVHNVDEAWAFFTAAGHGPAGTAEQLDTEFGREVNEPVLATLSAAQPPALQGDLAAFDAAVEDVEQALRYLFYVATFKYLDGDEVGRAAAAVWYLGIAGLVEEADAAAHRAILDAVGSGDAPAGRAALNSASVLSALGVSDAREIAG